MAQNKVVSVRRVVKREPRQFVLQEKLDGFRCTAHKENGVVRLVSRQGKPITGLVDVEKDIAAIDADNFVIDGELLLKDRANIPSKLQYKATSKIVSSKDPEKHGITLNAFDIVSEQEWQAQESIHPYMDRYETLQSKAAGFENISIVENLYVGNDESVIEKMIVDAKAKEWEGLMIRFCDSKYAWKRSKDLLKVIPFQELDAYIIGYEEGTNSNAGKLGAFLCEVDYKDMGKLKFKVGGGYSDEERDQFWAQRDSLVGRIISVQYFEITNNAEGNLSVRFPEFLELKEEGSTINN